MNQHDVSTEGVSQGAAVGAEAPPVPNLTAAGGSEAIEVKVEAALTRVDSIEGGRRVSRKQKLRQKIHEAGLYLKAHDKEQWYGFKVALTMVLGSLAILLGPLYDYFGVNSYWVIISVGVLASENVLIAMRCYNLS